MNLLARIKSYYPPDVSVHYLENSRRFIIQVADYQGGNDYFLASQAVGQAIQQWLEERRCPHCKGDGYLEPEKEER